MKCSRKVPADFIGVFMSIVITKRRGSVLSLIASGRDSALFSITLQTFRTSYWVRFYYSLNLLKNFSYNISIPFEKNNIRLFRNHNCLSEGI